MNNFYPNSDPGPELKLATREMIHDLNNMLVVIAGYSELIKTTHTDPETLDCIERIMQACTRSEQLIRAWRKQINELIPAPEEQDKSL